MTRLITTSGRQVFLCPSHPGNALSSISRSSLGLLRYRVPHFCSLPAYILSTWHTKFHRSAPFTVSPARCSKVPRDLRVRTRCYFIRAKGSRYYCQGPLAVFILEMSLGVFRLVVQAAKEESIRGVLRMVQCRCQGRVWY